MAELIADRTPDPLAGVAVLDCLAPEERLRVGRLCRLVRVHAGAQVISEDREGQDVLLVLEGRVRVITRAASGRQVSFAEIGPGGHVGELAALDGGPRAADVEAITDCRIAILPPRAFHDLLHWRPCIAVALLRHLARIIRDADRRITELSTLGAVERLARELLRRAAPVAGGTDNTLRVEPIPTQEQLASVTGATRETVARLLGQLQQAGITRRSGSRLMILEPVRLEQLALGRRL